MMGKKEECRGCIGFTDEHTCEGWDEFQRMKADKGKCHACAKLRDEIGEKQKRLEANERAIESYQNDEAGILKENTRLRKALDDLVTLKDYRDWHGKTPEYLEKKPLAWQQARDALSLPTVGSHRE